MKRALLGYEARFSCIQTNGFVIDCHAYAVTIQAVCYALISTLMQHTLIATFWKVVYNRKILQEYIYFFDNVSELHFEIGSL